MEKPLSDLIEIIHFTEIVSAKIHGVLDKTEIFRILKEQFMKSKIYTASIMLLTDEGLKLRVTETSLFPGKLKAGEKATGIKMKGYKIDLNKSSIFSQVVREGKTVQANVSDILAELFPRPLAFLTSKTLGFENRSSILTPLKLHEKIIGAFAMSSTELTEYFIPSVKSLAQHISSALGLADECDERKKVEQELRESEEKYRSIIENINDILVSTNAEGKITYISPQAKRMGFSPEEIVSKNIMEFILPEDRERVLRDFKHTMMTGEEFPTEFRMQDKEGRIFWFEDIGRVQRDETGKIVGLTGILRDITEHKRAEEELRHSENKYRTLTKNLPQKIFIKDKKSVYISCNKNYARDLKIEPDEITGKTDYDFYPKELAEKYRTDDKRIMESRKKEDIEERYIQNGENVWVHTVKTPVKDDKGNVIGILGIFWDITERKKTEEALRESREKRRSLLENIPDFVITVDRGHKILMINRGVSGVTVEKAIGTKVYNYVERTHHKVMRVALEKVFQTEKPEKYEVLGTGPKGPNTAWYETRVYPNITNDQVISVTLISSDITERKQAEETLRDAKEKWISLTENTNDIIMIIDSEGIIQYVNRTIPPYTLEKTIGKMIYEYTPKEFHIVMRESLRKVFKTGEEDRFEVSSNIPKIGTRWFSTKVVPIKIDSKIVNVIMISTDITERKRMEAELTSSHKKLRELSVHLLHLRENERKSFAHAIHDDLGQLLTVLKMDLSRLYKKLPPSQKTLQGMTKSLIEQAEKTMEVVQRISTELRPRLLDDVGLIPAIKWQVQEFQKRTGIRCKLNIIPQDIHLDHDLDTTIFRILQEGLTNIARHANATRVEASLKEKNGKLILKIRDNGKGITKKQISDPNSFGLMGIQERILSLEGKFEIKGIKDKGTTITIRITLEKK